MNLVSDTKSRKLAVVLCLLIVTVGISSILIFLYNLVTIFGGWLNSIPIVIVSQFIQGFGTSSMLSLSYAFLSDFCSDRIKPRSVIIVNTAWYVILIMAGVYQLFYWDYFILFK
jgi:MFS family permease